MLLVSHHVHAIPLLFHVLWTWMWFNAAREALLRVFQWLLLNVILLLPICASTSGLAVSAENAFQTKLRCAVEPVAASWGYRGGRC